MNKEKLYYLQDLISKFMTIGFRFFHVQGISMISQTPHNHIPLEDDGEDGTPNNRVHFCWPFSLKQNQSAEILQQQLENLALKQLPGHHSTNEQTESWVWSAGAPISDQDLFPRIKRILQNQTQEPKTNPHTFFPCKLTPEALNWLNLGMGKNSFTRQPQMLGMQVTSRSSPSYLFPRESPEKLKQQTCFFTFNITNIYLYLTQLEAGVLTVEVQYQQVLRVNQQGKTEEIRPISATDIQEANYRMYRTNAQSPRIVGIANITAPPIPQNPKDCRQVHLLKQLEKLDVTLTKDTLSQNAEQSLSVPYALDNDQHMSLLNQFLPIMGADISQTITIDEQRVFTFSQLLLTEHPKSNEKHKLGYQIAQKESYRYAVCEQAVAQATISDNQDIVHYQTHQGGCILITTKTHTHANNEFLKQYIANNGTKIYLPIVVMALIEKHFLEQLTQQEYINLHAVDSNELRGILAKRIRKLLNFRTNYRLTKISYLSNHNRIYQHWRSLMQLNHLLEEQFADVKDSHELINLELEKQTQRKLKRLESVGVFAAALIFLFGLFGMNIAEITNDPSGIYLFSKEWDWQHSVSIGTLTIAGIFVWLINKNNK